jgi:predicted  nucleic acid-binding Zn-ribbon protein
MWTPEARPLSEEEQATVARLKSEQQAVQKRQSDLMGKINAEAAKAAEGLEPNSDEYREKRSAAYAKYRDQMTAIHKENQSLATKIGELVPAAQRKSFVWLYERL